MVIHADQFAEAISNEIRDLKIKAIKTKIGAIDQFTDNTDVGENLKLCRDFGVAYKA